MALTSYDMTGFVIPAGTFTWTLYSDHAGLTKPTGVCLVEMGDKTEDVEYRPFVYDTGTMEIVLAEDYTVYTEGFWWKVLESNNDYRITTEFKFMLGDGAGSTTYFWGRVAPGGTDWDEVYDDGAGVYVRICRVTLMPLASKLKDIMTTNVINELQVNVAFTKYRSSIDISGDASLYGLFVKATSLFGAIMAEAGFSSTVTVIADDIEYKYSGVYYGLADIYVYIGQEVIATGAKTYKGFLSSLNSYYWPNRYQTGFDLLQALCRSFGVVARINESQTLDLYARRRSFATTITMETPAISSHLRSADELLVESVRVTRANDATDNAFIIRVASYPTTTDIANIDVEAPPDAKFDVDYQLEYHIDQTSTADQECQLYYLTGAGSPYTYNVFSNIRFYDYSAAADSSDYSTSRAAVRDYVARLYREPRKIVERTYGSMRASDGVTLTFVNLIPFKRISINQGDASRTFYAKRITMNPEQHTSTVEWLEE